MKKTSKRLHVSRVKIEYKLSNAHVCNNNNIYIYIRWVQATHFLNYWI